ncbi:unnamed protein product, partial [Iphiclides podalirius]
MPPCVDCSRGEIRVRSGDLKVLGSRRLAGRCDGSSEVGRARYWSLRRECEGLYSRDRLSGVGMSRGGRGGGVALPGKALSRVQRAPGAAQPPPPRK